MKKINVHKAIYPHFEEQGTFQFWVHEDFHEAAMYHPIAEVDKEGYESYKDHYWILLDIEVDKEEAQLKLKEDYDLSIYSMAHEVSAQPPTESGETINPIKLEHSLLIADGPLDELWVRKDIFELVSTARVNGAVKKKGYEEYRWLSLDRIDHDEASVIYGSDTFPCEPPYKSG